MQQTITSLFHKRMDRREFLRTLLLVALTVVGLGIIARHIGKAPTTSGTATPAKPPVSNGAYGNN